MNHYSSGAARLGFVMGFNLALQAAAFAVALAAPPADGLSTITNEAARIAGLIAIAVGFIGLLFTGINIQAHSLVRSPQAMAGALGSVMGIIVGLALVFFGKDIMNLMISAFNTAGRATELQQFR